MAATPRQRILPVAALRFCFAEGAEEPDLVLPKRNSVKDFTIFNRKNFPKSQIHRTYSKRALSCGYF